MLRCRKLVAPSFARSSFGLHRRSFVAASNGSTDPPTSSKQLPDQARVVIVGGGIIGCSVAYHLAKMGWKDVVLLERDQLTSGTTWHAAGLMVTYGSLSETSTEIRKYTKELYRTLEAETGQSTGFKPVGFIEIANDEDYLEQFRRTASFNRYCGVDVQEISAREVRELFPLADIGEETVGFYVADDGRVNPVDAAMALSKGARMHGARIAEGVSVQGFSQSDGKVTGVQTNKGHIKAEYVVNCAGMWARQVGQLAGVNVPLQAAEHYYLITDDIPEVDPSWPVLEDPAAHAYYRPEGAGLMVGLFEPEAAAWNVQGIPQDFSFGEIEPDWERMAPFLDTAMRRIPRTLEAGVKKFFCGPESFTPDLAPVVGEAPELQNFFVCAGMNSIGILSGGGMGRLLASWIINGKPDMDVTGFNIDRLHPYQANEEYRAHRVVESLGLVYKCHYPSLSMETSRGVKRAALHSQLEANGAYFKDVSGWEAPDWFAPPGVDPKVDKYSWGRHNWFPYWEAEHQACREAAIVMDMSFMSKFLVQGRDAGRILNYMSTANVNEEVGNITYTQWLNDDGKMEADLTVLKLEEEKFMVVATDTMHRHVETMIKRSIGADDFAVVTDVTSGYSQLNLQGPNSRALLQQLTSEDVSNEAFPFLAIREIDIGYARLLCTRITYLGELGYELCIPSEHAAHVYERIIEEGANHGLKHAGLKALSSLRMEKGYRDYGHDMDNTDRLMEVGLGFTCDFDKPGGFVGREAVLAHKAEGVPRQRLLQVLVEDPEPMMYHGEVVYRDGVAVGDVRAASYGHSLGGAVGLAMVRTADGGKVNKEFISTGDWQVQIAGKMYPAKASAQPMYDPKNLRIKS